MYSYLFIPNFDSKIPHERSNFKNVELNLYISYIKYIQADNDIKHGYEYSLNFGSSIRFTIGNTLEEAIEIYEKNYGKLEQTNCAVYLLNMTKEEAHKLVSESSNNGSPNTINIDSFRDYIIRGYSLSDILPSQFITEDLERYRHIPVHYRLDALYEEKKDLVPTTSIIDKLRHLFISKFSRTNYQLLPVASVAQDQHKPEQLQNDNNHQM